MMKRSKATIAGWILSGLLAAFLAIGSAGGKFVDFEGKEEMFGKLGWTSELLFRVGILEVVLAVLFLFPRTGFVAAILLTGYLGGATATHVRVGDPFFFPVVIGVLVWVALGLRDRRIFQLACPTCCHCEPVRDSDAD